MAARTINDLTTSFTGSSLAAADLLAAWQAAGVTTGKIRADALLQSLLSLSAVGTTFPVISPAQITSNQNNYSPGIGPFQRWNSDAARTVTGVVAGAAGEFRLVYNIGTAPITLATESGSSTAANRMTCVGAVNLVFGAGECVQMVYSGDTSRWLISKVRSDSGEGTFIVRQPGGTVGTAELELSDDGTQSILQRGSSAQNRLILNTTVAFAGSDNTVYLGLNSTQQLVTRNGLGIQNTGANGAGFVAVAAGVIAPATTVANAAANTAGGFFQNTGGEASLASAFTRSDTTLTATNLSLIVTAGRSYRIEGCLSVANSTATEGMKFDFGGGTCTATTFFLGATAMGSVTPGTVTSNSLTGVLNYSVITGTDLIAISGFLKVNAGGSLVLRAAENSTAIGTMTLGAGSWVALYDTVQL